MDCPHVLRTRLECEVTSLRSQVIGEDSVHVPTEISMVLMFSWLWVFSKFALLLLLLCSTVLLVEAETVYFAMIFILFKM